jgi:hypothetical protein
MQALDGLALIFRFLRREPEEMSDSEALEVSEVAAE